MTDTRNKKQTNHARSLLSKQDPSPVVLSTYGVSSRFEDHAFCSQGELLIWPENSVWSYLFSKIIHYVSGHTFYSSSHMVLSAVPMLAIPAGSVNQGALSFHFWSLLLLSAALPIPLCSQCLQSSPHLVQLYRATPKKKKKKAQGLRSQSLILPRWLGGAGSRVAELGVTFSSFQTVHSAWTVFLLC